MEARNPHEAPKQKRKLDTGRIIAYGFLLAMAVAVIIGALNGFGR